MSKKIISNEEFLSSFNDEYHRKLIYFKCYKYRKYMTSEDFNIHHMIGTWKALRCFDKKRGFKFPTLLTKCVETECKKFLFDKKRRSWKFYSLDCEQIKMNKLRYSMPNQQDEVANYDLHEFIEKSLSKLSSTEYNIIRDKFFNNQTLEQIAKPLNITKEGVRQRINRILCKLRSMTESGVNEDEKDK
jgi:RNA polymerase sigma factor (sigma-70 family)